jgi:hypothetical protein
MWIRIRAVIVEDEPLAAEYLATFHQPFEFFSSARTFPENLQN